MTEEWITTEEALRLTGYSRRQLYRLLHAGTVKGEKYVTAWKVERSSLLAYYRKQNRDREKRGPKRKTKS